MARRRYLSTEISTDTKVNRVALKSDFAALLYTWLIPHAGDDAVVRGDPEKIMLLVIPGRRDKSVSEFEVALQLLHDEQLIVWDEFENTVTFPASAFYKHQSYIKDGARRGANNTAEQRTTDDNGANPRTSAQNTASFKSSFSSSSSLTPPTPSVEGDSPPPKRKGKTPLRDCPSDFEVTPEMRASAKERHRIDDDELARRDEHFWNYVGKTGKQYARWDIAWKDAMGWTRDRASPQPVHANGSGRGCPFPIGTHAAEDWELLRMGMEPGWGSAQGGIDKL